MKKYNVGIIGFGFIGKVHAYAHVNLPFFYDSLDFCSDITHVCTSRQETAEKAKAVTNAQVATTDYRDITENPDIDIVHICSPNHMHVAAVLSAMKHGKHIYCDKPLTATFTEAEKIEEALKEYQQTHQMTFQLRFFPATMRMKQMIEEGVLGDVLEFRTTFLHAGSADPQAPLKWKLSAEAGGGVIADIASHAMDLTNYLIGDFDSLIAETKIAYPARPMAGNPDKMVPVDAEDCVMMMIRMKNGALGHIEGTKIATGTEDELRIEIHGSKGALRFNSMEPHFFEFYDATVSDKPIGGSRGWTKVASGQRYPAPAGFPGPKFGIGWIRSHMACLYSFMDAVHSGKKAEPGIEQGIYVQKLMERVRKSAQIKAWVEV
jgi:predicted dehydrogenase